MKSAVETISTADGRVLACIVRANWHPKSTEFLTPDSYSLQMGMIVYGKDKEIVPHMHLPVLREVQGTDEVVMVRSGACEVDIFDESRDLVCTKRLSVGDVILLRGGGHGFRLLEDTVLFEVKQGPYVDGRDKEKF